MERLRRAVGTGLGAVAIVAAMVLAHPAAAHHSFFGEFDFAAPMTVKGVVVSVTWRNPHIEFALDVKGRRGAVTRWTFAGAAAAGLERRGVSQSTIKVGDEIRVDGFRALDGSHNAAAGSITLPTGKRVFVGSLEDPTPI